MQYMHVEMHLYPALRNVSVLPSAVMWKGLTQGLTTGATDGAFSYPSCSARTHMITHTNARARTHTHTHRRMTNTRILLLPFSWVAWLLKRSTRVIPRLWRPDRIIAHLAPVNETWDMDGHAIGVHLRWECPRMLSDAGGGKKTPFLRAKLRYFPRNQRRAESTAGDADEWREGFLLRVYCEWSVVTLARVLGGIKGLFLGAASVEPHTAQSDLKHRTNQEGVQTVRTVHARAISQSEGCLI